MELFTIETIRILDPDLYVDGGCPQAEWTLLRRRAPVFYYEWPNTTALVFYYEWPNTTAFWAVAEHADIVAVPWKPKLFRSGQVLFAGIDELGAPARAQAFLPQPLNMNPPEHGGHRSLVNRRFTQRSVQQSMTRVEQIAAEVLDSIANRDECDFMAEVSAKLLLTAVAKMFVIQWADWPLTFRLSNAMICATDSECTSSQAIEETLERTCLLFFHYFRPLIDERRKISSDDLSNALAHGQINAQPLPQFELSYSACSSSPAARPPTTRPSAGSTSASGIPISGRAGRATYMRSSFVSAIKHMLFRYQTWPQLHTPHRALTGTSTTVAGFK